MKLDREELAKCFGLDWLPLPSEGVYDRVTGRFSELISLQVIYSSIERGYCLYLRLKDREKENTYFVEVGSGRAQRLYKDKPAKDA